MLLIFQYIRARHTRCMNTHRHTRSTDGLPIGLYSSHSTCVHSRELTYKHFCISPSNYIQAHTYIHECKTKTYIHACSAHPHPCGQRPLFMVTYIYTQIHTPYINTAHLFLSLSLSLSQHTVSITCPLFMATYIYTNKHTPFTNTAHTHTSHRIDNLSTIHGFLLIIRVHRKGILLAKILIPVLFVFFIAAWV
jgi:hypothetical protein